MIIAITRFRWCGRRALTARCASFAGCLLGSPLGRLRTIRYSNVHRTFELRSCPRGFESLFILCVQRKNTHLSMSVLPFVDYDLFEPPWLRLTFFEQVAELAFSTNKVHKKIFSSLNFLLYILLYCAKCFNRFYRIFFLISTQPAVLQDTRELPIV